MSIRGLSEKELTNHLEDFVKTLELVMVGQEMRLGAFRFDAIAYDRSGTLVIIELKVNATKDTLAQLLLYPHALRKFLKRSECIQRVRTILITTHVDLNVVEIVERLSTIEDIDIKICRADQNGVPCLVSPRLADDQIWDQSLNGKCNLEIVDGSLTRR